MHTSPFSQPPAWNRRPAACGPDRFHDFDERLSDEARHAPLVDLLFAGHRVEDVSKVRAEQKNGNDFLLHITGDTAAQPVRCENKFESYAADRVTLEWVSVDRPRLVPGWLLTSRTGWLLSWFLKSGDLLVWPMQALREQLLAQPLRHQATSAFNRGYLSWSTLEDVRWLLEKLPDARAIDLRAELGQSFEEPSRLRGAARRKVVPVEEVLELMARSPRESQPLELDETRMLDVVQGLARIDRKRTNPAHAQRVASLLEHYGLPALSSSASVRPSR